MNTDAFQKFSTKYGLDSVIVASFCESFATHVDLPKERSYASVTPRLMEDTMLEIELHTRYCDPVFIGLLSSRMPVSLSCLVMNVKELVILVDVKKCL